MGLGVYYDNSAAVPARVSVVLHVTYETKDDGLESGEFVLSARVPPKHSGQFDQQFLFVEISKVHSVTIRKVKSELVDSKIWEAEERWLTTLTKNLSGRRLYGLGPRVSPDVAAILARTAGETWISFDHDMKHVSATRTVADLTIYRRGEVREISYPNKLIRIRWSDRTTDVVSTRAPARHERIDELEACEVDLASRLLRFRSGEFMGEFPF